MSDCDCIPDPGGKVFAPDEIIIYGVSLRDGPPGKARGELLFKTGWQVTLGPKSNPAGTDFQIVAAYGYAYEGHCYRFDRPRVLMFASNGLPPMASAAGCGFNISPQYQMWRVPAEREVMELTAQIDTFRKVVLEANLPGRRPPNTYASDMMMAHRGGRLTGPGS